jgi:hypothetical protein
MKRIALALLVLSLGPSVAFADETTKPAKEAPDSEKVRALKAEIVRAASALKEENREKAKAVIATAPRAELAAAFTASLLFGHGAVRTYAARELAARKESAAVPQLVVATVKEDEKKVRVEMIQALRALEAEDTALLFGRHLAEKHSSRRLRAILALGVFRDVRAVGLLVEHLRITLSGYHHAYAAFTTERAVIRGWRLVSGGTGNTVVEVADPEIGVVRTGVVLDVEIRRVEIAYTVAVLQDLTGQEIGADVGAWQAYLAETPDLVLAAPKDD